MGQISAKQSIFGLLGIRFGDVSSAENAFLEGALSGHEADCSNFGVDDLIIRGELLSWLCTTARNESKLTHQGVSLLGAEIRGNVDLTWARLPFPISAIHCEFRDLEPQPEE